MGKEHRYIHYPTKQTPDPVCVCCGELSQLSDGFEHWCFKCYTEVSVNQPPWYKRIFQ